MSGAVNKNLYTPEKAKIIEARMMTETDKYFKIRLLERKSLGHKPGQFVMVTVFGVGEVPISLPSGSLKQGDTFELVVRNLGNVTQALHNLPEGAEIGIRGPLGTIFDPQPFKGKDILIIGAGLGIVPVRSLILDIVAKAADFRKITILYGMKHPGEMLFKDELESWHKPANVDMQITVDKGDSAWKGHVGLITTLIPPLNVDPENTYTVIVGPPVMYKFALLSLQSKKIPHKNIFMSFERKMKCGVGKCGNCQIHGKYTCKDGAVFCYDDIQYLKEAL